MIAGLGQARIKPTAHPMTRAVATGRNAKRVRTRFAAPHGQGQSPSASQKI